jgi:hypothetical protein
MNCFRQDPVKVPVRWLVFRNRPDVSNQKYYIYFYQLLTKKSCNQSRTFCFVEGIYDLYR